MKNESLCVCIYVYAYKRVGFYPRHIVYKKNLVFHLKVINRETGVGVCLSVCLSGRGGHALSPALKFTQNLRLLLASLIENCAHPRRYIIIHHYKSPTHL